MRLKSSGFSFPQWPTLPGASEKRSTEPESSETHGFDRKTGKDTWGSVFYQEDKPKNRLKNQSSTINPFVIFRSHRSDPHSEFDFPFSPPWHVPKRDALPPPALLDDLFSDRLSDEDTQADDFGWLKSQRQQAWSNPVKSAGKNLSNVALSQGIESPSEEPIETEEEGDELETLPGVVSQPTTQGLEDAAAEGPNEAANASANTLNPMVLIMGLLALMMKSSLGGDVQASGAMAPQAITSATPIMPQSGMPGSVAGSSGGLLSNPYAALMGAKDPYASQFLTLGGLSPTSGSPLLGGSLSSGLPLSDGLSNQGFDGVPLTFGGLPLFTSSLSKFLS